MDITETYDMHNGGLPRFTLFKDGVLGGRCHAAACGSLPLYIDACLCSLQKLHLSIMLCIRVRVSAWTEEEYPALKSKKARTAQGIFDYMNKMEGGR